MPANSKRVKQTAKTAASSAASDFEFDEERPETAVVSEGLLPYLRSITLCK